MPNTENHGSRNCFRVHLVQPPPFQGRELRPTGKENRLTNTINQWQSQVTRLPVPCASQLPASQALFISCKCDRKNRFYLNSQHWEAFVATQNTYLETFLMLSEVEVITPYDKWMVNGQSKGPMHRIKCTFFQMYIELHWAMCWDRWLLDFWREKEVFWGLPGVSQVHFPVLTDSETRAWNNFVIT